MKKVLIILFFLGTCQSHIVYGIKYPKKNYKLVKKFLEIPQNDIPINKSIHEINIPDKDFDTWNTGQGAYIKGNHKQIKHPFYLFRPYAQEITDLFKFLYNKNNPATMSASENDLIPKIIHQIWVGPKSRAKYDSLRQTVIDNHPGWLYMLWTDEEVKRLRLYNRKYYDLSDNYAEKADFLRYEILYMFGGVYVDMDYESVRPFDFLIQRYDFFVGIVAPNLLCNAVIGSAPGHPILRHCIKTIKNDAHLGIPFSAGPVHITKSFYTIAPHVPGPVIALPSLYFYPGVIQKFEVHAIDGANIQPETFGIHHWAYEWLE